MSRAGARRPRPRPPRPQYRSRRARGAGAEIWENFESFASNSGARTHPRSPTQPHNSDVARNFCFVRSRSCFQMSRLTCLYLRDSVECERVSQLLTSIFKRSPVVLLSSDYTVNNSIMRMFGSHFSQRFSLINHVTRSAG